MRIDEYLKDSGLSLSAFARKAGVSEAAMSRYAAGKRMPRPAVLRRIVEASGGRIQANDILAAMGETGGADSGETSDTSSDLALLETVHTVDLVLPDISGIVRGKRIPPDGVPVVLERGLNLCASVFALDSSGQNVEESGLVMASGDADNLLMPADGRVLPVPWALEPTAQLLMTMTEPDGTPFYGDPRHALAAVVGRFAEQDLTPVVALEPEFYLLDRARDARGMAQPVVSKHTRRPEDQIQVYSLTDLDDHAAFLADVHAACRAQDLPARGTLSEYGTGQYEVNLNHGDDPVAVADHTVLLKRTIKGVARRHGMDATFMAKPFAEQAGSGLHVHVSLVDKRGRNVFTGAGDDPISPVMRHAIGGLRETMGETMAMLAPNANSYRRFQAGSYAPLAPTWGIDNRTVSLRVPMGPPEARRIEHRVAGADANPYLTMAAVLAGIHYGITRKIDPGPPLSGNAYEQAPPSLPRRWSEALTALDDATVLPDYFDPRFLTLYATCKRVEMRRFEAQVTPLEHDLYLPMM